MTAEKVKYGILSYAAIVPRFVRGMRLTENGCPIQLSLSSRVLFDNGLTIYMDRARIEIPDYWKASKAVIEEGDGTVTVLEYPCPFELQYEMEHYSRCILEKRTSSPINTPDMTIRYISMCEKLYESFETPQ